MKAKKCVDATLTLLQIAIVFNSQFRSKSLSGQGEELSFDDGSELIVLDDGGYLIYDKQTDIYNCYDSEGRLQ
jgi:hypothetical protein